MNSVQAEKTVKPQISIITPSYNQGPYIEQNIRSVLNQNYPSIQHIVMDGGSTDDTVSILKRYPDVDWVSEEDEGQADALAKGLERATGDIVGWVNSDDYYEDGIFDEVAGFFEDPGVMWVIGNISFVMEPSGRIVADKSPDITFERLIENPDILRQQAAFFRRGFLEEAGGWNKQYHMIMDYELWLRLSRISRPKMVDRNWAYFRLHELQKTSHENYIRQSREICEVMRRYKVDSRHVWAVRLRKRRYWLKGYIKSLLIGLGIIDSKYRSRPIRMR